MKLIYFFSLFTLLSCGTSNNITEATAIEIPSKEVKEESTNQRIIGTVHLSEACGVVINAEVEKGKMMDLYIVNLEEKYHVEGMKLKFEFSYSRAMIPEGCSVERAAAVYDVTIMR